MNFLKAVADGVHSGFSAKKNIQDYRLGSSANIAAVKKALIEKDLIMTENKGIILTDPVMGLWLKTL